MPLFSPWDPQNNLVVIGNFKNDLRFSHICFTRCHWALIWGSSRPRSLTYQTKPKKKKTKKPKQTKKPKCLTTFSSSVHHFTSRINAIFKFLVFPKKLFHCSPSCRSTELVFKYFTLCIANCQAEEIPIMLGLDNRKFPLLSFLVCIYLSGCEIYSRSIHLPPKSIHQASGLISEME